jgi:glycosyltransferase involved in cell wall biosynthesis
VLCRTPVVSSLVNVAYGPDQQASGGIGALKLGAVRLLDAATARPVVRFHAVSEHVAEVMASRLHLRRSRVEVVPRGRDPELLGRRTPERRTLARARLGVRPEEALVLAVGRQEPQKGFDTLVEAAPRILAAVPTARVFVAGREGTQTPRLQALVDRLGLHDAVQFLGTRRDVGDLLCAADVFAFPTRWEGMPGAVLEAMALQAPIVATALPVIREVVDSDVPPVREAVRDGVSARLVPPGQPEPLATAIVATLDDRAGAAARAARAHADFQARFTISRAADGMLTFYDHAMSDWRGRRTAIASTKRAG